VNALPNRGCAWRSAAAKLLDSTRFLFSFASRGPQSSAPQAERPMPGARLERLGDRSLDCTTQLQIVAPPIVADDAAAPAEQPPPQSEQPVSILGPS
jgi:hypothetical protein